MIIILTFIAFTGLVALISWYKTRKNLSTKEGYFLAGRNPTGLVIAKFTEMTNFVHRTVGRTRPDKLLDQHGRHELVGKRKHRAAGAGTDLPAEVSKAGITTVGISGGSI